MIFIICLSVLAGLLFVGALIDIESRRLPNGLTATVAALYGLYVAVSPTPVDWVSAVIVASAVFALGFVCFAFQLMGGGDVKLMAGLALWSGLDHIMLFLVTTSLAGGLLSIVMLLVRRCLRSPSFLMLSSYLGPVIRWVPGTTATAGAPSSAESTEKDDACSLPYGVAIAAGGFAVIHALLQL